MTPATEALVERLEERAASYRQGGPSSEHTAALLDDAAAALRALSDRCDALIGFAAHDDDCTVNRYPGHDACSCGLSSILQQARHEQIAENANCSPTDFFAENAKNPPPAGEE